MHLHQYFSGVYQSPRLDALHLHTMYIRVGRMNKYKEEWMMNANALIPTRMKINSQTNQVEMSWTIDPKAAIAVNKTARAMTIGVTLAAMDGPLPVMDVVGLGVSTGMAIHAWYEYFS